MLPPTAVMCFYLLAMYIDQLFRRLFFLSAEFPFQQEGQPERLLPGFSQHALDPGEIIFHPGIRNPDFMQIQHHGLLNSNLRHKALPPFNDG